MSKKDKVNFSVLSIFWFSSRFTSDFRPRDISMSSFSSRDIFVSLGRFSGCKNGLFFVTGAFLPPIFRPGDIFFVRIFVELLFGYVCCCYFLCVFLTCFYLQCFSVSYFCTFFCLHGFLASYFFKFFFIFFCKVSWQCFLLQGFLCKAFMQVFCMSLFAMVFESFLETIRFPWSRNAQKHLFCNGF